MRKADGKRVVLTRSAEDCADWAGRLEALGFTPVIVPCIDCEFLSEPALAPMLSERVREADWLVFTSRRGVEAFASLHETPLPGRMKIAAVGKATAAAAEALLGRIDLTGRGATAAALADDIQFALARGAPDSEAAAAAGPDRRDPDRQERLLLVLAENAAGTLERKLGRAGISRSRVNVYRTVPTPPTGDRTLLSSLAADGVFLASPTAVEGFVNRVDVDVAPKLITIGTSTSAAVRARGLDVAAEARAPGLDGLLEAMQCLS